MAVFARAAGDGMVNLCRTCAHAYLRLDKSAHFNYEACAYGLIAMSPFLECSECADYEREDSPRIAEAARHEHGAPIVWGPEMEIWE